MATQRHKNWGEIEDEFNLNQASLADAILLSDSCDVWGAYIETTLLTDLSEAEQRRLAEHVSTCSACASRVRLYQRIEDVASELPRHNPFMRKKSGRIRFAVPWRLLKHVIG